MKKLIFTFSLFIALCLAMYSQNTITVTGTVTNSANSQPVPNHVVNIMIMDSMTSFYYQATTNTSTSGQYSFTVANYPAGAHITLSTLNCQNQIQYSYLWSVPYIANFSICVGSISCSAMFSAYPDSSISNKMHFYNQSTGNPTSFNWNFGDGTSSNLQNPTHTYATQGTYLVTLSISGNNCQSSYSNSVVVGSTTFCQAFFTKSTNPANGLIINFYDQSTGNPNSWVWNFGDGTTSNLQNPVHTYALAGTYNVSLAIAGTNCQSIYNSVITASNNTIGCQAAFTVFPDSMNSLKIFCFDQSTGNPTAWSWNFGDGTSSTLQNPTHTYATPGTYLVTLSISGNNCQSSFSNSVVVGSSTFCQAFFTTSSNPANGLIINFYDQSTGNPTSWMWNFGDGTSSNVQNPVHTYALPGTYNVLLAIAGTNCQSTYSSFITASNNTLSCQAAFTVFPDSINNLKIHCFDQSTGNPTTWNWNFGDGTSSASKNPNHTYSQAGIYNITLNISGNNCQSIVTQTVSVGNLASYSIGGFITAGSNFADHGKVLLFNILSMSPFANAITSINNGFYLFQNVVAGQYRIIALLDSTSSYYGMYAPTYYGNTTVWNNATVITINASANNYNISLAPIVISPGPGNITGSLVTNVKSYPLSGIIVKLLNSENKPAMYTQTDNNGKYKFNSLAFGTYKIWPEIPGIQTNPVIVTISQSSPSSNNNTMTLNGNVISGIGKNPNISNEIQIYPNPFSSNLTIKINLKNNSKVIVELINLTGQKFINQQVEAISGINTFNFNLDAIPKGYYVLKVISDNEMVYILPVLKE